VRRQAPWLALAVAAALAGSFSCGSADSGSPGGSGGSGGSSATGGRGGSGGSNASGGSGTGGSSGGSAGGGGGSGGSGGSSAGAGGSTGGAGGGTGGSGPGGSGGSGGPSDASAGADGNPTPPDMPPANPCAVTLTPLAPQRWANLAAAPGSKLRVGATAGGTQVPAKPSFDWRVTHNGTIIDTTVVGGDPAVVEFPTVEVGQYQISVTVTGVTPACTTSGLASAIAPNNLVALYRIRAIAPETRGLAPLEADLPVSVGATPTKTLELTRGRLVKIAATDERNADLPGYFIQLRSRTSTVRVETFRDNNLPGRPALPFEARLDERRQVYDLLIIPVPGTRAPRLYTGLVPDQFGLQNYVMVPGTRVSGTISAGGVPLPGARLRLRDGLLPSTIGESGANGAYELRVRGGRFEIRVLPPPTSGLPEATLPESAGVIVPGDTGELGLDFQYASLPTTRLDLTVNGPDGATAGKPIDVLVQSLEGELTSVGSFALPQGPVTAGGSVRVLREQAPAMSSFTNLPRARYRITVAPPVDLPGNAGITSAEVDLRTAGASAAHTVTLKARTPVKGQLTGTAPIVGLKVRATDAGEDGFRRSTIVNVNSDGSYQVPADVDRLYRLSLEPAADRSVPRIPLIPIRGRDMQPANTQALPRILTVKGSALGEGQPLPGVVIQIYCLGNAPDCIAEESPDISNTLPIDETVSGSDGSYELRIPEPN
jgi:hypothetical protein